MRARTTCWRLPSDGWAIATSGTRAVATTRLTHAGLPLPTAFVTSDDVERGKPNPDPYLLAAVRLGIPPHRCVVIEDAPAGVEAGLAAGAQVIAVASTHTPDQLTRATAVVGRLTEFTIIVHEAGEHRLTVAIPPRR
ncbi:MAG: HAD-IA family hydrolase [Caldilineaceae bacterium]